MAIDGHRDPEPSQRCATRCAANLDSGAELGASIVVDIDGHTAVDLCGRLSRHRAPPAVGVGHHHQRVVDDEWWTRAWPH
ncbi:MAG: hypothetical protein U5N53_08470 [Mycobacterium sp.]|nr:hypothetical protein [Mycobacterium sp.]